MSKLGSVKGVLQTMFQLSKEDWNDMDRRLLRISIWAVSFIATALFWLFFLRNIIPF